MDERRSDNDDVPGPAAERAGLAEDFGEALEELDAAAGLVSEESVRRLLAADPGLLGHLSDVVSILDRDLRFLYVSRITEGRKKSEVIGVSVLDHIPRAYQEHFRSAFERSWSSGAPGSIECLNIDDIWWETRFVPLKDDRGVPRMLLTSTNITERKRREQQLLHVQKMEAIGQLTAGIAHNFNNLLSIVLPNVELCRTKAAPELQPRLDDIEHAAVRASEMVRQLMLFARHEVGAEKHSTDLGQIVRRTANICRATFERRISIELFADAELPPVMARAGEIEQVLLNICINARDALEEARTDDPRIALYVERASAQRLRVRVSDNGPGIRDAARARLFEPFFTTKEVGRGTGLGLASAYGIVADHQGRIACESEPGAGTTFVVELPVASERIPAAPSPEPAPVRSRGTETLLLIDDEAPVRRALRALLEQSGFRVFEAGDGCEGLELAGRQRVDLVVLDRSMPRMSGEQFLTRLGDVRPGVPVVLLTGQPGTEPDLEGAAAVVMKPPKSALLLRTIRQLLDENKRV